MTPSEARASIERRMAQQPGAEYIFVPRAWLTVALSEVPRGLSAAEVRKLASWIRTPGNIDTGDAVDECARLLENNARAIEAARRTAWCELGR